MKPEDLEPEIMGFDFFFDAFQELSTTRSVGMGIGPIPFTAIAEYFKIYELSNFDDFVYIIRQMDLVFMELNAAEADKPKDGKKSARTNTDPKNSNQSGHR